MIFTVYENWNQLPPNDELIKNCNNNSIFLSRTWLEQLTNLAKTKHHSLFLACVIDNGKLLAILPLTKSSNDQLHSLSNHFTPCFSLLIDENSQQHDVLKCLAEGLAKRSLYIKFEPIDKEDNLMESLSKLLESNGFDCYSYFRFFSWRHRLQGQTFDMYMSTRPSNLRNTILRKQRKLQREHCYNIKLFIEKNIEQALSDYQKVYSASWKANETITWFTPSFVKKLSCEGLLRLAVLYVGPRPIAAQIWIVANNTASIYRLAYDEKWKQYSPGSILTKHLMQHVIEIDKVREIDFLIGNERYKQDWMTKRYEFSGVRFIKRSSKRNKFINLIVLIKNKLTHHKSYDQIINLFISKRIVR